LLEGAEPPRALSILAWKAEPLHAITEIQEKKSTFSKSLPLLDVQEIRI